MKNMVGTVISLKNTKTALVLVERQWQHPLYKKYVKRTKRYACHVDGIELNLGEVVEIKPIVPVSKTKKFGVVGKVGGAS